MTEIKQKNEQSSLPPEISAARLLVVDDEPHIRSAVARALSLRGYNVEEAESGSAALELLEKTSYDLMILDMRMPGMDGTTVMEKVYQLYPELSIIVLTGYATLNSAISAVRTGAVDYLLKPVAMQEITDTVERALHKRAERLQRQRLMKAVGEALDVLRVNELPAPPPLIAPKISTRFVHVHPLTLDCQKRLVVIKGDQDYTLQLTEGETFILASLMSHPEQVLTCSELVLTAWNYSVEESEAQNLVRPHIFRLRRKIEMVLKEPRLIHTLRKRGYFFSPRESSSSSDEAE